jgi:hypothetical protein
VSNPLDSIVGTIITGLVLTVALSFLISALSG